MDVADLIPVDLPIPLAVAGFAGTPRSETRPGAGLVVALRLGTLALSVAALIFGRLEITFEAGFVEPFAIDFLRADLAIRTFLFFAEVPFAETLFMEAFLADASFAEAGWATLRFLGLGVDFADAATRFGLPFTDTAFFALRTAGFGAPVERDLLTLDMTLLIFPRGLRDENV